MQVLTTEWVDGDRLRTASSSSSVDMDGGGTVRRGGDQDDIDLVEVGAWQYVGQARASLVSISN